MLMKDAVFACHIQTIYAAGSNITPSSMLDAT